MKRNILILLGLTLFITFVSCKKDLETEGISKVTYFPVMEMSGDDVILNVVNVPYVEPGVKGYENGEEIDVVVSVDGIFRPFSGTAVDVSAPNRYTISYTAFNVDGYSKSLTRDVYVVRTGDLVTSIEGLYTATVKRPTTATAQYTNMKYVMVLKTGANTYLLSDAVGGYYDIGRGYGYGYAFQGAVITANDIPGNSFTVTQSTAPSFGNTGDVSDITVDPVAKTISFKTTCNFASNGVFNTVLTQVQL